MNRSRPVWKRLALDALLTAVLAVLLYAALGPHSVPETFGQEDKLYHLAGFAALAISTRLAFPHGRLVWQTLAILALGAAIEVAQIPEPARTATPWDFLFDAIGTGLGLGLMRVPWLRRLAES